LLWKNLLAGPRAGLNWNDGHGGNNVIEGNLIFNMVRETGDHGIASSSLMNLLARD
jgi:hypothetical protein